MVQVYGFTQLWDGRGNWYPAGTGKLIQFTLYDVCYGNPCTGIYDQGQGLAGAQSSIFLDTDALGIKGYPEVEVGFSINVGFVAYYNPDTSHSQLQPLSVRTVLGGDAVYDDLVPFLYFNGVSGRLDAGSSPPMTTISHTNTVTIPYNRSLEIQILFDLTPTINAHPSEFYTPFLITDRVSLYVEGRPEKPAKNLRPLIVGVSIGWIVVTILAAVLLYFFIKRRKQRQQQQGQSPGLSQTTNQREERQVSDEDKTAATMSTTMINNQPVIHHQHSQLSLTGFGSTGSATGQPGRPSLSTYTASDALSEYAAANRAYISPELEEKLRIAAYFPFDNPDMIPASTWNRRYGVTESELKSLRELYEANKGWRQRVLTDSRPPSSVIPP